ncbi:MAG TPA: alpha-L-arabinofuranosidase C-terminal domain-containing protein [Candidatus Hydrogenedentes bacterium]|nr:alpha-L-arabinofuranosidase C-terminal domain-containing protein [Candidatus Hydrogenedentota bacterium]HOL77445.1 alpha-L-arabinofuranosidase C-terminal domain-containing protein [Candidatus Hydrogenedentota bacterium]HPO86572.1 alpha-L-arabinofuranosidase C-terminal domain-containing protein [Candidatus Hydrogenedentota bacterium]
MSQAQISVWTALRGASISPNLYGHFAEHLGRCIYEGIWVGPKSRIANQRGLRLDVIAALSELHAPVIRWPGGCFADAYHWRDGIGRPEDRPKTVNLWWRQSEPNDFGTDEFMHFCRSVGAEPYICLNVGSGSPREALEWLEYCNYGGESTLTALRKKNGQSEPYGVKFWGVGNENWGCGGRYSGADYAKQYIRFATYLRAFDPSIQLIACGHGPGPAWSHDFCDAMSHADLIDHISVHRYFARGKGAEFSDSEYRSLFGDLHTMERDIQAIDHLLGYFYPDKHVGLVIDEWGVWHPEAHTENGLEQPNTLRDAVFAGACLNLFNRYARRITMANIAQTINVLQCLAHTSGAKMVLTPTYHVFEMMRPHMGAKLLMDETSCDVYETHPAGLGRKMETGFISSSVSLNGKRVFLTLANQTPDIDVETKIVLKDASIATVAGRLLHASKPSDVNSFTEPKKVYPRRIKPEAKKNEVVLVLPAHAFASISITIG